MEKPFKSEKKCDKIKQQKKWIFQQSKYAEGGEGIAVETQKLVNFSCEVGRQLLQNGAEIYRVEESVEHILRAYGYEQIEVFAIPACIIINVQEAERNYTKSVRIKGASNNLGRLTDLNTLCREICRDTPDVDEDVRRLRELMAVPLHSQRLSYMAYCFAAFFFTLFWGGSVLDALVTVPCGLIVKATVSSMAKMRANIFFTNLIAGTLMTLVPLALIYAGAPLNLDKIIIGGIMLLVPGIAITNAMRDVLAGDFLTALSRMAEVLIVAMGISIGVAIAITGTRMLFGTL